jgi:hypothetical protein
MFLGVCALLILVLVPLTGGSFGRLAAVKWRWVPLAVAALALQVLVISVWPTMPHSLAVVGHLASYLMLGAVVWANRSVPGMLVIAAGAGANALAIAINGGTLPASAWALRHSGVDPGAGFHNSGTVAHPHLAWLGDVMVTPTWLPLRNMLSIGDLVLLAGAIILVIRAGRNPTEPPAEQAWDQSLAASAVS